MIRLSAKHLLLLKTIIHLGSLVPLILTFYQAVNDQLGGDPVEALLHFTGIGAFNLLLLSLAVSPLAKFLKMGMLIRTRRLIGIYAFVYALSHFLSFIFFELQLEWSLLISEIVERPYITVGFAALLILLLMTTTSTQKIQQRLGKYWQKLHNWVYLSALLIALHYIWSVKSDITQPIIYWVILIFLLVLRKDKFIKPLKKTKKTTKKLA